jgi:hypothetical protein
MQRVHGFTNYYAIGIGLLLLVEGIWAMFSPVVFGVFTTNAAYGVVHIILGLIGIWAGLGDNARGFCLFLGTVLLAVGLLSLMPGIGPWFTTTFNANMAVAHFNIIVGLVSLLVAFASGRPHIHRTRPV